MTPTTSSRPPVPTGNTLSRSVTPSHRSFTPILDGKRAVTRGQVEATARMQMDMQLSILPEPSMDQIIMDSLRGASTVAPNGLSGLPVEDLGTTQVMVLSRHVQARMFFLYTCIFK
jgi:hypothetical protein